jgi:hypothetical protein
MSRSSRFGLAVMSLAALWVLPPRCAAARKPPQGVECSWTCDCATQLKDYDSDEAQWEVCRDTKPTVHPQKIEACDGCKALAENACKKRVCPPDPKKGPKFVFTYFCDGKPQAVSMLPDRLRSIVTASPSISLPVHEKISGAASEARSHTGAPPDVKCTFSCSCSVAKDMCDEQEQRLLICHDKQDSTLTGDGCQFCWLRATLKCGQTPCPLIRNSTKVVSNFKCPVN